MGVSRTGIKGPFREVSGHDHPEVCDLAGIEALMVREVLLGTCEGLVPAAAAAGIGNGSPGTRKEDSAVTSCVECDDSHWAQWKIRWQAGPSVDQHQWSGGHWRRGPRH